MLALRLQPWTGPRRIKASPTAAQPSFNSVKRVLAQVPEVLDADKEGIEEADAYVLAMALNLWKRAWTPAL